MPILPQLLMGGSPVTGATPTGTSIAESVDFDGTNDYLSRSSDFVGNVDSKTFTFSCWVYSGIHAVDATAIYHAYTANDRYFEVRIDSNTQVTILSYAGSSLNFKFIIVPKKTWSHILVSCDLSDVGKRHVYVNDASVSVTWSSYDNFVLPFTNPLHTLGAKYDISSTYLGRLAHLFLSYDYIDLSVESNRRLFITEDLKPADGLAALNPIMYFPMTDHTTCHINEGTGGDMVQNGVIGQSERGPNQWNCVASEFDGVNDYLDVTEITATNGKTITFSSTFSNHGADTLHVFSSFNRTIWVSVNVHGNLTIRCNNASLSEIVNLSLSLPSLEPFINNSLSVSFNTSSVASLQVFINNINMSPSVTVITFIDEQIIMTDGRYTIGNWAENPIYFRAGSLGELYFDTTYTDLSTNNPFWDSDQNCPKPVRQVIEETGVTPLIAMPISADNPGKNYGTGGDFTLNGGGLTGARGASEFWARSMSVSNTGGGSMTLGTSFSDSYTLSYVTAVKATSNSNPFTIAQPIGSNPVFRIQTVPGSYVNIGITASSGTSLYSRNATTVTLGDWIIIIGSVDMQDSTKDNLYVGGLTVAAATKFTQGSPIELSFATQVGLFQPYLAGAGSGDIAFTYFTTDYIDFSDENNRLKFVDGLGYPVDIQPAIDAGDIPKPLFYLPFDDPDNLGKDMSGNDNHFTVNGTVTSGLDFSL